MNLANPAKVHGPFRLDEACHRDTVGLHPWILHPVDKRKGGWACRGGALCLAQYRDVRRGSRESIMLHIDCFQMSIMRPNARSRVSVRDKGVIESISPRERLLEDEGPWRVSNVVNGN